jgi:hypothetical protein
MNSYTLKYMDFAIIFITEHYQAQKTADNLLQERSRLLQLHTISI